MKKIDFIPSRSIKFLRQIKRKFKKNSIFVKVRNLYLGRPLRLLAQRGKNTGNATSRARKSMFALDP
jgi:hypothetical protein